MLEAIEENDNEFEVDHDLLDTMDQNVATQGEQIVDLLKELESTDLQADEESQVDLEIEQPVKRKRGNPIRTLTPDDLTTVEGRTRIYQRLDLIFTQTGIADSAESIDVIIDGYIAYHTEKARSTIAQKLEAMQASLGMNEAEFKAHLLEQMGITNISSSVEYAPVATSPETTGKPAGKSRTKRAPVTMPGGRTVSIE